MINLRLESLGARKELREFALKVLDDPEGIRIDAYAILCNFLQDNGSGDICNAIDVDGVKGRVFIGEDVAEDCLREIGKWEEAEIGDVEVQSIEAPGTKEHDECRNYIRAGG